MDLEDGVAADAKGEARDMIRDALCTLDFGRSDVAVRVNSPSLDETSSREDIQSILDSPVLPKTLCVPKIDTVDQFNWVIDTCANALSRRVEPPQRPLALVTMCETPTGLLNLPAIAQRGLERNDAMDLQAVIFGGDDYAAEAGATRSSGNAELMMARQTVVAVCRAYGLQPLDIVNINISSDAEAALRAEAAQGKAWGFAGKQIIHPSQIDPVQAAFSPSTAEVEAARELLAAYQTHYESGDGGRRGAFSFNGKMIDMPTVLIAQNVVAQADALPSDS